MMFDLTISLGNILTVSGTLAAIALYIIDTRYSASGTKGEVAGVRDSLKDLQGMVERIAAEVDNVAREHALAGERVRRDIGETMLAHREKVREVELYIRDNYVRTDVMRDMNNNFQNQFAELRAAMARIEQRLTDN